MSDIDRYLEKLKSNDPNERYHACERLRAAPSIPKDAIIALRKAMQDSDSYVADAAKRAVVLHTSRAPSSTKSPNKIIFIVLGLVLNFIGFCLNFDRDPTIIKSVLILINLLLLLAYFAIKRLSNNG